MLSAFAKASVDKRKGLDFVEAFSFGAEGGT
jgi:hypothetical protein